MREPDYLGNCDLLKKSIIGFFSSRTTAPLSVIPTLDLAHEVARKSDAAVMSGFQSPMEREVLDILLGGKCGIIVALNRSIYRKVPPRYAEAFASDRLLFVSLIPGDVVRPSTAQAAQRNTYIASTASSLIFSSVTPSSSLYYLIQEYSAKPSRII